MNEPPATRDVPPELRDELNEVGYDDATQIGRGGFGTVVRCHQSSLDRMVAIKVLTGVIGDDDTERFFREQRALGRLSGHPNIVEVFGVGTTTSGRPYLVMPYHSAGSLDLLILREGPLTWAEGVRFGIKIAGSLESAHRLGIVHRDIKPSNILISAYGEPILSDFGIARVSGVFETNDGRVTGSPAFIAPEILHGAQPTPKSDIYGLGATIFAAITGHAPFERQVGQSIVTQFLRITSSKFVIPHDNRIPNDVRACIEKAMSRDPADRYTSAMDFGNRLREIEERHQFLIDEMVYPLDSCDSDSRKVRFLPAEKSERNSASDVGRAPRSGNLPSEITKFIGRRKELAFAKKRLSTSRLVSLTGIGGVGKSRLAIQVGTSVRRAFTDGVWLVELGEVQDSQFVGDAVSIALGLRSHAPLSQEPSLIGYLADKQLLLILDNCEHQLVPVSELVQTILQRCPNVHILATSRAPLGITGETTMPVPSLSLPGLDDLGSVDAQHSEAMALFLERATAVTPTFSFRGENGRNAQKICRHLDGLPLAIELAAVRLRSLSTAQILHRLSDRYQLLTTGSRVAPPRQQTLRLCVDWSYDLCTPVEKQIWAKVSVFSAGFELDAAEAICGSDLSADEFFDVISSLVDMSILTREEHDSTIRYRLLETLRAYGEEKITDSDEHLKLLQRHRRWYEQLVEKSERDWFSPRQLSVISRLERERPNLREALRFGLELRQSEKRGNPPSDSDEGTLLMAARLFPFWIARGNLSEGRTWLDRVLESTDDHHASITRFRLLCITTAMAGIQGDIKGGTTPLEPEKTIRELARNHPVHELAAWAAGCGALYSGEIDSALEYFERAAYDIARTPLTFTQSSSVLGLALAHLIKGQAPEALQNYELLRDLTAGYREHIHLGRCSVAGGWALWDLNQPQRAVSVLKDGLELAQAADDSVAFSQCVRVMAWMEADIHQDKRAVTLLGAADTLWREIVGARPDFLLRLPYQRECEKRTRGTLGDSGFTKYFKNGHQMNADQIFAYVHGHSIQSSVASHDRSSKVLTKREDQVASLVAEGLSNKAIADRLVISHRTAQGHVENILVKLGFHSRAQIAAWKIADSGEVDT